MNQKLDTPVSLRGLFIFALPTLLSNVFMGIYGVVDGIFAANCIGLDALSCVNLCMPIVTFSLLIGVMLGVGGNALVAKKLGEGKSVEAKEDFTLFVVFGTLVSVAVSLAGLVFLRRLLQLLGADERLMSGCRQYAIPLLLLIPLTVPGVIFEMFLITVEHPLLGMMSSIMGGVTNIFLDWLLIRRLRLGLVGASVATCMGYTVPAVIGVAFFAVRKDLSVHFVKPKWRWKSLAQGCMNGSSEMVGLLAVSIVTVLMNNILMRLCGSDGVAAVSVILYAQGIFASVMRGYVTGISPVVSFKFGQRKTDELIRAARIGFMTIALLSAVSTVICWFGADELTALFVDARASAEVCEMAIHGFRIFSLSVMPSGFNILASGFYTALNDGLTSAILSFSRTFVFMVLPLALLPKWFSMDGVWWSFVVSELLALMLGMAYMLKFKRIGDLGNL